MNINRVSQKVSSGIPKFAQKIISELVEGGVPDGLVRSELNPTISKSGWELVSRARVHTVLYVNTDGNRVHGIKLYKVDDQVRVHSVVDSKDGTQGYLVSGKLAEFR